MRIKRSVYIISAVLFMILLIGGGLAYIYWSEPLKFNGSSTRSYEDGREEIVFDLTNTSRTGITIHKVKLNGKLHEEAMLGMSIDTGQLVQSGTDNKGIQFFPLSEYVIRPRIPGDQVTEVIKKQEGTPIHYGILVERDEETIEQLTLTYSFYGFRITRTYHIWPI